jgi:Mg-chelatase subunit ChlD
MEQELLDPITYELFDYPISVPCCGRSFDKASLQRCLQTSSLCPLCSTDIRSFDVDNAPKNINISSLVDVYKQQQAALQVAEQKERERHVWSATLIPVLQDIVKKAKFTAKPSVVICAIDYSGSMCSQTMQNQVRAALKHIMSITANTNHAVETMLIEYQSTASILAIKDKSLAEIHALIDRLSAGGGTNFEAAFTQIYKVMDSCDPQKIGSISIIFMTDGENNYSRGSTPQSLLDGFKTSLADHDVCSKHKVPVTVHSVGFGQSCDRNLLESMRLAGSEEGIFRFAEPSDTASCRLGRRDISLCRTFRHFRWPLQQNNLPFRPLHASIHRGYWIGIVGRWCTRAMASRY